MVKAWGSRIRQMKTKGKTQLLTIPKEITSDSSYPFKPGQVVYVKITEPIFCPKCGEKLSKADGLIIEEANGAEKK